MNDIKEDSCVVCNKNETSFLEDCCDVCESILSEKHGKIGLCCECGGAFYNKYLFDSGVTGKVICGLCLNKREG